MHFISQIPQTDRDMIAAEITTPTNLVFDDEHNFTSYRLIASRSRSRDYYRNGELIAVGRGTMISIETRDEIINDLETLAANKRYRHKWLFEARIMRSRRMYATNPIPGFIPPNPNDN